MESVEVVLVPFDMGAVVHGGVHHRHHFVEPVAGHDEAADMLREMARKADQLLRQSEDARHGALGRVEAGTAGVGIAHAGRRPAPGGRGERADGVLRQAEGLADLAHRRTRAVGDDGRGDAGAVAAVFVVDVLDHLLAPLVLEIDVDVGRLVALGRDEALEEELGLLRIDLGDAEAEADGRVRRRAAALAEDLLLAGVADDVVDGEEVRGVVAALDQFELMRDQPLDLVGHAAGIAEARAGFGELDQRCLRARGIAGRFVGILIAELVERERQALEHRSALGNRLRMVAEQARHLGGILQVPLGIGFQPLAGGHQRHMLADAGEHVLQRPPFGPVIEHVIGGKERHADTAGKPRQEREPAVVAGAMQAVRHQADAAGKCLLQRNERRFQRGVRTLSRHDAEDHARSPFQEIGKIEMARRPSRRGGCLT